MPVPAAPVSQPASGSVWSPALDTTTVREPGRGTPFARTPSVAPSLVEAAIRSPGRPLDGAQRELMEARLGHDFSRVRIHSDAQAAESAGVMRAAAYTVGRDIVFAPGRFAPETEAGRRLLTHELAHVVQQRGREEPAAGTPLPVAAASSWLELAAADVAAGARQATILELAPSLSVQCQPDETAPADPLSPQRRLLASFDVDRPGGNRRPWKLDALTRAIVEELSRSERAYVRIFTSLVPPPRPGARPEDELADRKDRAWSRAETVRSALIQWIGPKRFSEARFEVAGFLNDRAESDPQIEVWVDQRPMVVSEGVGRSAPRGTPGSAAKPAEPSLPKLGLEQVTTFGLPLEKKDILKIELPGKASLSTPAFAGASAIKLTLSGELDVGELLKGAQPPPAAPAAAEGATAPAPVVKPGPPASIGLSFSIQLNKTMKLDAVSKADLAGRKVTGGITFVETGTACEFIVPVAVLDGINAAVKDLRILNRSAPEEKPTPEAAPLSESEKAIKSAKLLDALYKGIEAVEEARKRKDCTKSSAKVGASVTVPTGEQKPEEPKVPVVTFHVGFSF
jgi:hypothetical protein